MLFDKLKDVWDNKNAQGFLDLHHDDFEWLFHSNGRVIKKSDWTPDDILNWMTVSYTHLTLPTMRTV